MVQRSSSSSYLGREGNTQELEHINLVFVNYWLHFYLVVQRRLHRPTHLSPANILTQLGLPFILLLNHFCSLFLVLLVLQLLLLRLLASSVLLLDNLLVLNESCVLLRLLHKGLAAFKQLQELNLKFTHWLGLVRYIVHLDLND
jgi:hypothetical protein